MTVVMVVATLLAGSLVNLLAKRPRIIRKQTIAASHKFAQLTTKLAAKLDYIVSFALRRGYANYFCSKTWNGCMVLPTCF